MSFIQKFDTCIQRRELSENIQFWKDRGILQGQYFLRITSSVLNNVYNSYFWKEHIVSFSFQDDLYNNIKSKVLLEAFDKQLVQYFCANLKCNTARNVADKFFEYSTSDKIYPTSKILKDLKKCACQVPQKVIDYLNENTQTITEDHIESVDYILYEILTNHSDFFYQCADLAFSITERNRKFEKYLKEYFVWFSKIALPFEDRITYLLENIDQYALQNKATIAISVLCYVAQSFDHNVIYDSQNDTYKKLPTIYYPSLEILQKIWKKLLGIYKDYKITNNLREEVKKAIISYTSEVIHPMPGTNHRRYGIEYANKLLSSLEKDILENCEDDELKYEVLAIVKACYRDDWKEEEPKEIYKSFQKKRNSILEKYFNCNFSVRLRYFLKKPQEQDAKMLATEIMENPTLLIENYELISNPINLCYLGNIEILAKQLATLDTNKNLWNTVDEISGKFVDKQNISWDFLATYIENLKDDTDKIENFKKSIETKNQNLYHRLASTEDYSTLSQKEIEDIIRNQQYFYAWKLGESDNQHIPQALSVFVNTENFNELSRVLLLIDYITLKKFPLAKKQEFQEVILSTLRHPVLKNCNNLGIHHILDFLLQQDASISKPALEILLNSVEQDNCFEYTLLGCISTTILNCPYFSEVLFEHKIFKPLQSDEERSMNAFHPIVRWLNGLSGIHPVIIEAIPFAEIKNRLSNKSINPYILARCLPCASSMSERVWKIAREIMLANKSNKQVENAIYCSISSGGCTGSYASELEKQQEKLENFLGKEDNAGIKKWLQDNINVLKSAIEKQIKDEEQECY